MVEFQASSGSFPVYVGKRENNYGKKAVGPDRKKRVTIDDSDHIIDFCTSSDETQLIIYPNLPNVTIFAEIVDKKSRAVLSTTKIEGNTISLPDFTQEDNAETWFEIVICSNHRSGNGKQEFIRLVRTK